MDILICDDIKKEADKLTSLLLEVGFSGGVVIFENGYDALEYMHTGAAVDICFLDIIMPEMNGVLLAGKLRQDGFTAEIVFCTTSNEYACESYNVEAFDYLIKPPPPENLKRVLDKFERIRKSADTDSILLKTSGIAKSVMFRNISHVEVIQHKVYFRLTDCNVVVAYATFKEIAAKLLSGPRFVQCHRSYIVNMEDIAEITTSEIITQHKARIPITRNYYGARNAYFKWKFGGN